MDIKVYNQATEILKRIKAAEELLAKNDVVSFRAISVQNVLSDYVSLYKEEFLEFVNQKLEEARKAFDALQCCSCDNEPEEKEEDGGTT